MKKGVIILVIAVIIVLAGWFLLGNNFLSDSTNNTNVAKQPINQQATLEAVGEYSGSGTATSTYNNGAYTHTVNANIGDPAEGKFYEGWIVRKIPFKFISTGKLEKVGTSYSVTYTSNEDLTAFTGVVITEETEADGQDNKPEAHVLEGDF
jgi:hypothetical protein